MSTTIQIAGKSGCKISIQKHIEGYRLIKSSSNEAYSNRLILQAQKQQNFLDDGGMLNRFKTPYIHKIWEEKEISHIEMAFIHAESYSTYLSKLSKHELDTFVNDIRSYFEYRFKNTSLVESTKIHDVLLKKIDTLTPPLNSPTWESFDIKNYLIRHIPKSPIHIGVCHGDFTLSNMLFARNNTIYLIDFLDSFIETPIIDFVKLRQDTKYLWSLHIESKTENKMRLIQALNYIDKKLVNLSSTFPYLSDWEHYITVFNFVRIIPYISNDNDNAYIRNVLSSLLTTQKA